jgi:hypothetical protein
VAGLYNAGREVSGGELDPEGGLSGVVEAEEDSVWPVLSWRMVGEKVCEGAGVLDRWCTLYSWPGAFLHKERK